MQLEATAEAILGVEHPTAELHDVEVVELVLPATYLEQIRSYLFQDLSREFICHVLCGHARLSRTRLRLLGCYLVIPEPDDYLRQSVAGLNLDSDFDYALRVACKDEEMSLVDIHSHPFTSTGVAFSGVDDADEEKKHRYFRRNLPKSVYASIVMGRESMAARAFLPNVDDQSRRLPLRVISRSRPLDGSESSHSSTAPERRYDRQIRAFGSAGQNRLGRLKVGVVGAGGLGSKLAIGLARLGVRDLVLMDPDHVDHTNLNRLAGAGASDADSRRNKVDVLADAVRAIDREARPCTFVEDVISPRGWSRLRDCDLLVAATDSYSSRMLLNQVANQYLIPIISVGVNIRSTEGRFDDANAEVHLVVPGERQPCLLCSQTIDTLEAYYELAPEDSRRAAAERGYIEGFDEPAPAVYHLDGLATSLALVEIHNLVCGFKPAADHLFYWMATQRLERILHEPERCAVCFPDGCFGRGDRLDPVVQLFPGLDDNVSPKEAPVTESPVPPGLPHSERMGVLPDAADDRNKKNGPRDGEPEGHRPSASPKHDSSAENSGGRVAAPLEELVAAGPSPEPSAQPGPEPLDDGAAAVPGSRVQGVSGDHVDQERSASSEPTAEESARTSSKSSRSRKAKKAGGKAKAKSGKDRSRSTDRGRNP